MDKIYDLIIIGSGPAGMSASVYASKAKLSTLIFEKDYPGGKVVKTSFVENWPGEERIEGYELATKMFEHSTSFGSEYSQSKVVEIINDGDIKKVVTEEGTYKAYAVIVATGTKERKIGIPGEDEYYGKGVSYCAICDGSLYKDCDMVVIGGGNSALQESLYLANFAKHIYLVHRRDTFRAEETLIEEIKENEKIDLLLNYVATEIHGNDVVNAITVKNLLTGEIKKIDTEVVFPFIGSDPESSFLKNLGVLDDKGHVIVNEQLETTIPGLFAAGDVIKKELRQIVTAVSDGAIAATNAYHYIKDVQKKNKK